MRVQKKREISNISVLKEVSDRKNGQQQLFSKMKCIFIVIAIYLVGELNAGCRRAFMNPLPNYCLFVEDNVRSVQIYFDKYREKPSDCDGKIDFITCNVKSLKVNGLCHDEMINKGDRVMNDIREYFNELRELDLSNNCLTKVNLLLPNNLKSLETLIVNNNELSELDGLTRDEYPNLKNLVLSGNQFSCEYVKSLGLNGVKIVGDPCDGEGKGRSRDFIFIDDDGSVASDENSSDDKKSSADKKSLDDKESSDNKKYLKNNEDSLHRDEGSLDIREDSMRSKVDNNDQIKPVSPAKKSKYEKKLHFFVIHSSDLIK